MTGLENILAKIEEDARARAEDIRAEAARQAAHIREQAQQEADIQRDTIASQGKQKAADTLAHAQSAAALAKRQAELAAKQRLINETIEAAREQLLALPTDQYFSLLQKLAVLHALPQAGQLILSPEDKARKPALFEEGLNAALSDPSASLTVAEITRPIDGGVILVYGGIEENCSFEALFSAHADELQDMVQALLF